jgi:hypothetical protein
MSSTHILPVFEKSIIKKGTFCTKPLIFNISLAKLQVFDEVTSDGVWKSLVGKMRWLSYSETIICKEKCYMSARNRCGKVIDVTSDFDDFLPKNDEKDAETRGGDGTYHL